MLLTFTQPLVILGEPGMGKTELMKKLGKSDGCTFITAAKLLRQPDTYTLDDNILVVDGLDEVAGLNIGDPLHNVLKKLVAWRTPRFIITCRSAEWNGATGKLDILDEYGEAPLELKLEPLSDEDALQALSQQATLKKAREAVSTFAKAGLDNLYRNPLTLKFIIAVLTSGQKLPETRAELYELAVNQLRLEENKRHGKSKLAQLSKEDALDAAGVAMAAMLMTGCQGITKETEADGALPLAELSDLESLDSIKAVIGSNLFKKESTPSESFQPLHRTVAEFLGARWLARVIEGTAYSSRTAERLFGLISVEGGIPASLRGLHAWLPKFSKELLGPKAIDQDPYGILLYGDGDGLTLGQARQTLAALKELAAFDPHFRLGWSHETGMTLKGLVQASVREEIRAIITDESLNFDYRLLILEAISASPLVKGLQAELESILLNINRTFSERRTAAEAMCRGGNRKLDWPKFLTKLIKLGDENSSRVAVGLIATVGFDRFADDLIACVIIADSGILITDQDKNRRRTFGAFYFLARQLPTERILNVLNALAEVISPTLDPEDWLDRGHHNGWSEFVQFSEHLILRQLEHDSAMVTARELWDWLRMLEGKSYSLDEERKAITGIIKNNQRLRQGVQRLALFGSTTEGEFHRQLFHMARIDAGLALTNDDSRQYLAEVVDRHDSAENDSWRILVNHFRTDDLIPRDIQKIARAYAQGNQEMLDFLSKKPKRQKLDDWELKDRRRQRDRQRRDEKAKSKEISGFTAHIEDIKCGELRWILKPAQAYLGMFSDLDENDSPSERLTKWLGKELCDAVLQGFEAVLHRKDLPTAKQIAESYAEYGVWNFVYPMLAGAVARMLGGRNFADLNDDVLSALAIAEEHRPIISQGLFEDLKDQLEDQLRSDATLFETHLRQQFEPMLKSNAHISGFYRFKRQDSFRPLSTRLSVEWLKEIIDLPLQVEEELWDCIIHASGKDREIAIIQLTEIAKNRIRTLQKGSDREVFWKSVLFLFDFESSVSLLPVITEDEKDWLWPLTNAIYSRHGKLPKYVTPTSEQLKWLILNFRCIWPQTVRPNGVTHGVTNSWDATELLEWAIFQLAKIPSEEAAQVLAELLDMPKDGYSTTIQTAIAAQYRTRIEEDFKNPTLAELKAVLANEPPQSAADVQAIILDEFEELQKRLRGDSLDLINSFYTDTGQPRIENECCKQMLLALGKLPFDIQAPLEVAMPQRKRSDAAFVYGDIAVPLEAKGQWHKKVWSAAETQLDQYYSIEHKAAAKGIYVVFWFGPKAPKGRKLISPSNNILKPSSAEEMRSALQANLPIERRNDIAIVVLDLTRP